MEIKYIKEEVAKKKRKLYNKSFFMSFSVIIASIFCIMINYFFRFSIIITFPVIIIPVFISALANFLRLSNDRKYKFNFKISFQLAVYGVTKDARQSFYVMKNLGKTIAIFVVSFFIAWSILWLLPAYNDDITELMRIIFSTNILEISENISDYLSNNLHILYAIKSIIIASQGVAILFFIFKILTGMRIIMAKFFGVLPPNKTHKSVIEVYRRHRRDYFQGFIYFNGFGFVLMTTGYLCGAALMIYKSLYSLAMPFGTSLLLLMLIPVLQNSFIYENQVMMELVPEIRLDNIQDLNKILKDASNRQDLTEEEKIFVRELLDASEKIISPNDIENESTDKQEEKRPD